MKNNIKAILLVAGEANRLRPYTLDCPKCMVEVNGVSLLDRQLSVLKSQNIKDIILIGGYKSEMLECKGSKLKINKRYYETNMVWTLFSAEDELDGDIIISYGDIVYSKKILMALMESTADIAVAIDKEWESYWRARNEDPLDDAETLKLDSEGRIIELGQKPKSIEEIERQYIGLIKLTPVGVNQLKEVFHKSVHNDGPLLGNPVENAYMTDLLQEVINSYFDVHSVLIKGGWVEVDTVSDLHSAVTLERINFIEAIK
jgi:L-glutamine-phosphate cytidylyltransferase